MDKNKRLAELLGVCWHEIIKGKDCLDGFSGKRVCSCGKFGYTDEVKYQHCLINPDFTDVRLVLREMQKRDDFDMFTSQLNAYSFDEDGYLIDNAISIDYILDETGLLRDRAIEWLERRKI